MSVRIDAERGENAAALLYHSFATTGIHGQTEMPEDAAPIGDGYTNLELLATEDKHGEEQNRCQ